MPPLIHRLGPAGRTLWLMHEPPQVRQIARAYACNPEWTKAVERFRPLLTVSGHDQFHQGSRMNPERKEILSLPVLPGRLTPAEAAWRLGFEPDHIPILVSLGLLKPLGHPTASTVKYFASVEIETLRNDPKWLAKATDALRHKWKLKNEAAKRRSGNGQSPAGNGQSYPRG